MFPRLRSIAHCVFVSLILVLACGAIGLNGSIRVAGTAAAAGTETIRAADEGIVFAGEHLRLTAYFLDGAVHIVFSDGQERVLPQVVAASGTRYSDGFTTFWNKGDEAFVEWNGLEYTVQVTDPETDPWELARRAGVTLRAVGQEPGWLLEISDQRRVDLLLDYGDTHITTPIASMEVDFTRGATTYRVLPPTSPLRMTIYAVNEACYDPMSGEGFTVTVVVDMNGGDRLYRGCGRWYN